jgi:endoglucanase
MHRFAKKFTCALVLWLCPEVCLFASVREHGVLSVRNGLLTDAHQQPVVLRGVSYGWSQDEAAFYNPDSVAWLRKDWEVSVIRATVGVEPENAYLDQPAATLLQTQALIEAAFANDLYIIVAWHCNTIHAAASKAFFLQLAQANRDRPNLMFEILTEPDDESWDDLKTHYRDLIGTLRNEAFSNPILISAPYWTQNLKAAADNPLSGFDNLLHTVHFCSGESGTTLRETCEYALQKGLALIVSDHLLTDCSCQGKVFAQEWASWVEWFEKHQISWLTWNISGKNESCSLLNPGADPKGNWANQDLSEAGHLVRHRIKNLNALPPP